MFVVNVLIAVYYFSMLIALLLGAIEPSLVNEGFALFFTVLLFVGFAIDARRSR